MRQVLAFCTALVFVLSLTGAALAQSTQQPAAGSSSSSPSAPAPSPSTGSSTPSSGSSTTDTTKSTAPSGTTGKSDPAKPDAAKTDKSTAGKPAADKHAGGSARGQHKMMGEVTKIDSSKGMVSLKTDEGDLDLHFPPSALQGIKEGDRVEIQLAIRPAGAAGAGSKPAAGAKAPGAAKTDDPTKAGSGKAPASTGAAQPPKTQ